MAEQEIGRANEYLRSNVWPTGTRVQLLSVPWDSDYRDVVAWESAAARDQWFEGHLTDSWTEVNFNYLWPGQPVAVPVPYSTAYKYNYIAVTNPAQPVDDEGPVRTYYYFITEVDYLSPQASNLTVQLDVMTTYTDQIEFGRAFVERGHIAMANEALSHATYNKYLTAPEGIDVGRDYVPFVREFYSMMVGEGATGCWGVVVSSADLTSDPGTTSSPKLTTAQGGIFDNFPNGCYVCAVRGHEITALMYALKNKSWVAQCIIDIYLVPSSLVTVDTSSKDELFGGGVDLFTHVSVNGSFAVNFKDNVITTVKSVYNKMVVDPTEPAKLNCWPYSVIEIDNMTGNPVYLRPELVDGEDLTFLAYGLASVPNPKIGVYPYNYAQGPARGDVRFTSRSFASTDNNDGSMPMSDGIDSAVWFTDFPHISIVNNNYQLYLASTVNSRNYQYQSAGWSLDRANMSAQNAFQNTADTLRNDFGNFNLQNTLAQDVAGENRMFNNARAAATGAAGIGGGILNMQLGDSAMAAVNMGFDIGQNELSYNQSMRQMATNYQTTKNTLDTNSTINNRNRELANQVAKGDYQNAIAGINATVQDAALSAPSVIGQNGGDAANFKNSVVGLRITWKTITGSARETVKDYFRRYGYGIRRWLQLGTVRRMLCMSKFAYWKVLETSITCATANETERMAIRGVFEKGVTLWDAPESIGNTALEDNSPRPGYVY